MRRATILALIPLIVAAGCSGGGGGGGGAIVPVNNTFVLGQPIEGLPQAQLDAFMRGRELMKKRFKPSEGLGPFYNTTSCDGCHDTPTTGGSAPTYRNFLLAAAGFPGGQFKLDWTSPITNTQGVVAQEELPSLVLPAYVNDGGNHSLARPTLPDMQGGLPVTSAGRNAPPMFGIGLFEFVSNQTIMAGADPEDANQDGISGRFNRDGALNIGRFGYKAQANNIEVFIRGAAQNQMGMTTNPVLGSGAIVQLSACFLPQIGTNPDDPTEDNDRVPDPELSTQDFADIIAFCKFLAPPQKKTFNEAATRGETLFGQLGCDLCHFPSLPSSVGPLEAYTDLLIHDMGTALADGISQGSPQASLTSPLTTQNEFRTQPLWGVSMHAPFLHDGRADTLADAILAHGGEGQASRDAFANLTPAEQADLIAFLEHL